MERRLLLFSQIEACVEGDEPKQVTFLSFFGNGDTLIAGCSRHPHMERDRIVLELIASVREVCMM